MDLKTKTLISILTSGCLVMVSAAAPSVGLIKANGEFRVDGSELKGNSTLFNGSTVESKSVRSEIRLSSGGQLLLSSGSRVKVFSDHTVLEKGSGLVKNVANHSIEAGTLSITAPGKGTEAQISVTKPGHVMVSAVNGPVSVRNSAGVLVASVRPGSVVELTPQSGSASQTKVSGTLASNGGKYFVTDSTSNVTVEVQGSELAKWTGKQVDVSGSIVKNAQPSSGASQVVQVASIKNLDAVAGNAPQAGGAGAGAGAGAGMSSAAIVAIISGVAVAGTLGGLGLSGTFSSNDTTISGQ